MSYRRRMHGSLGNDNTNAQISHRRPIGVTLLVAFFAFGGTMCGLTTYLLLFPGTPLDAAWHLKPEAHDDLMQWRTVAVFTMMATGAACVCAAVGLGRGMEWGQRTAIAVLVINLIGDTFNAFARHDWRTLIGVPIGGLMVVYLFSRRVQQWIFSRPNRAKAA